MKLTANLQTPLSFDLNRLKDIRLAIVQAEFNATLTSQMTHQALQAFEELGGNKSQIEVFEVPGSFEIPLAAKTAALTKKYDAILCFGVVIKGETYHFESVADACVQGILSVMLQTNVPLIHGILTTYTLEQALERIPLAKEYLYAALHTLDTLHQIENKSTSLLS